MKKRILSILCICAMLIAMFTGCAPKPSDAPSADAGTEAPAPAADGTEAPAAAEHPSGLEYVEMDWFTDGLTEDPDSQMVIDALNEYLLEKLNLKLNVTSLPSSEYYDRLMTMLQSGEAVGVVQMPTDYIAASQQGLLYPIDELWDEYGVGSKALFNEGVWDSLKVNDHVYAIPSLKDNAYIIGYIYNQDLAAELGVDLENPEWNSIRDMEDTLLEAKRLRDEKHPEWADMPLGDMLNIMTVPSAFSLESYLGLSNLFAVSNVPGINDVAGYDNDTVFNLYETEEYKEFCLMYQRLVAANVCAYDYSLYENIGAEPSSLICGPGWGYTYIDEHMFSTEFSSKLRNFTNAIWTDSSNFMSAGYAIPANSPDPERAMMFIELMNTDPYAATLVRFGIEGEHYLMEDGKMVLEGSPRNSDPANPGFLHWYGASYGNLTIVNAPESYAGPDGYMFDKLLEYNNNAKLAAHMGLVIDTTNITNELAACSSVVQEFDTTLGQGQYESEQAVLDAIEAFNAKLYENGLEKILTEVQAQVDAFVAAK